MGEQRGERRDGAADGGVAVTAVPEKPPVAVGDVLHIYEPDYLYGIGILRLRVTKVGTVQRLGGNDWVDLEGMTLRPDGTELSSPPRHAVARGSALRTGLHPREAK